MIERQRALKHESRLGHRAFRRVNKQNNAVYHFKYTLNLAAEVSVAGGVNDIDFYILVMNRGVLRKNGDTSLALDIARVHNAGYGFLILSVNAALLEHFINQSGLSVVNVCNDRYVSQIVSFDSHLNSRLFLVKSNFPYVFAQKLHYIITQNQPQEKSQLVNITKNSQFVLCILHNSGHRTLKSTENGNTRPSYYTPHAIQ